KAAPVARRFRLNVEQELSPVALRPGPWALLIGLPPAVPHLTETSAPAGHSAPTIGHGGRLARATRARGPRPSEARRRGSCGPEHPRRRQARSSQTRNRRDPTGL